MKKMYQFNTLPNALTLCGLASSALAMICAINHLFLLAIILLIVSGIFDLLDGPCARYMEHDKENQSFGGHLDPLADACSHGACPMIILYCMGFSDPISIILIIFYLLAIVWRLSYFSMHGLSTKENKQYFYGLPTFTIIFLLPLFFLTTFISHTIFFYLTWGVLFLIIPLMLSSLQIRKPKFTVVLIFLLPLLIIYGALMAGIIK